MIRKRLFGMLFLLLVISSYASAQFQRAPAASNVTLNGANVIPGPGDPDGTGTGTVTIDVANSDSICIDLTLTNVALPITGVSIYAGAVGVEGTVLVDFGITNGTDTISTCTNNAAAAQIELDPTNHYVNVQNAEFANGAVRGQLEAFQPIATITPSITPTATTFVLCNAVITIPQSECAALEALYNSTNGASWINNASWTVGLDPCLWFGVTCTTGFVTQINLPNNGLNGTLPVEIGDFPDLTTLSLPGNLLGGSLPATMGNLGFLQTLNLSGNALSGEFPQSVTDISSLVTLDIGYNAFFSTNPTVIAALNTLQPGWDQTQTISPAGIVTVQSAEGVVVTWTPIPYTQDGGYYTVACDRLELPELRVEVNTVDKSSNELVISGLPGGTFTCGVNTYTPPHDFNLNEITSISNLAPSIVVAEVIAPPNDNFQQPFTFKQKRNQHFVFNVDDGTTATEEQAPVNTTDCPIDLIPGSSGIHYKIEDLDASTGGPTSPVVVRSGGPAWFRARNAFDTDTAIAVYEIASDGTLGTVVACADSTNVTDVKLTLDNTKQYRAIIWNEGSAPQGIGVQVVPQTFDITGPASDSIFTPPDAPTVFQWRVFPGAVKYIFEGVRISEQPVDKFKLVGLTPNGADGDGLSCDAILCTLTVADGSELDIFVSTLGSYLWSASGKLPSKEVLRSNQVFGFRVGEPDPQNLVVNSSFEFDTNGDGQPDAWTGSLISLDKVKCNKDKDGDGILDKQYAYGGRCAYEFRGAAGEQASLQQVITPATFTTGETLVFSAQFRTKSMGTGSKLTLKIVFSDQTQIKRKLEVPLVDTLEYAQVVASDSITITGNVVNAKIKLKNKSVSGKWLIDEIRLEAPVDTATPAALLPLDIPIPLPEVGN